MSLNYWYYLNQSLIETFWHWHEATRLPCGASPWWFFDLIFSLAESRHLHEDSTLTRQWQSFILAFWQVFINCCVLMWISHHPYAIYNGRMSVKVLSHPDHGIRVQVESKATGLSVGSWRRFTSHLRSFLSSDWLARRPRNLYLCGVVNCIVDTSSYQSVRTKEASWMRSETSSRTYTKSRCVWFNLHLDTMTWMTENLHRHTHNNF